MIIIHKPMPPTIEKEMELGKIWMTHVRRSSIPAAFAVTLHVSRNMQRLNDIELVEFGSLPVRVILN